MFNTDETEPTVSVYLDSTDAEIAGLTDSLGFSETERFFFTRQRAHALIQRLGVEASATVGNPRATRLTAARDAIIEGVTSASRCLAVAL